MVSSNSVVGGLVVVGVIFLFLVITFLPSTQSSIQPTRPNGNSMIDSNELSPVVVESVIVSNGVRHLESVDLADIHQGCSGMDCIPSIDFPSFVSVSEANQWLSDSDLVLGLSSDFEDKAYPIKILNLHEIVNDFSGGVPVLVTFCPLCFTGVAFERVVDGKVVEFGVSGKLLNSNLIMYDRGSESYWSQISGTSIVGFHSGKLLKQIPLETLEWGAWKKKHPFGEVLSNNTGIYPASFYGDSPYGDYDFSDDVFFPVEFVDDRFPAKTKIHGIIVNGESKVYPIGEVVKAKLVNDVFAGENILVFEDPETKVVKFFNRTFDGSVLDFRFDNGLLLDNFDREWSFDLIALDSSLSGKRLQHINSVIGFWFSWIAFNPDTEVFVVS